LDWFALSIVIGCLLVSAFFSASETALTGASRASMLRLSKQGSSEAGVVHSLFAMRERMIGALLGNNIANIGASALATGIFTAWFGEVGVLYATGVMTVLVVIFAEVLPKTIAINAPDRVSLLVARPITIVVYLLGPLLTVIEVIVVVLMKMLGIKIGANQPILCAARSICCNTRARSKSRTATCSAACWTCASCRSPTSWFTAPKW
jgi:Mg2+/Co2+ transporter CorB